MCLPALKASEKVKFGVGTADTSKPMAVLGAGTGLGVGHLIPTSSGYIPLPGEGGHVDWTAQNEQEWFIQRYLAAHFGHVSPERLLSGPGIESLYLAIAAYRGVVTEPKTAAEISQHALAKTDELCSAVIAQFFASLGGLAGDLALTLSTFGGVYVGGGIVPKLLPLLEDSEFRSRFEAKGRFTDFNRQIATYVVTAEQPGLLGCAVYLKQILAS
jgi:glucokinase